MNKFAIITQLKSMDAQTIPESIDLVEYHYNVIIKEILKLTDCWNDNDDIHDRLIETTQQTLDFFLEYRELIRDDDDPVLGYKMIQTLNSMYLAFFVMTHRILWTKKVNKGNYDTKEAHA